MQTSPCYNPMCVDCARLCNGCEGTTCTAWTGCIYKTLKQVEKSRLLHFGCLGNGVTVYDVNHEAHGDYETVAHISECGNVKFYQALSQEDRGKVIAYALQQQANYAKGWENYSLSRQMAEIEKCMKPLQAISELSKLYKAANEERLHALCLYHAQNCGYIQPQNAPQS